MPSTLLVGEVIHTNDLNSYTYAKGGTPKANNNEHGSRGVWWGGTAPPPAVVDSLDYISIGTTGNASDFGNLTQARFYLSGCSGHTRGVFGSGRVSPAMVVTMDYITIASTGNATDFGDMATARAMPHGSSDSHGGLQS